MQTRERDHYALRKEAMKYVVTMKAISQVEAQKPAGERTGHFDVDVDLAQILGSDPGPIETAHVRMRDGSAWYIDPTAASAFAIVQVNDRHGE